LIQYVIGLIFYFYINELKQGNFGNCTHKAGSAYPFRAPDHEFALSLYCGSCYSIFSFLCSVCLVIVFLLVIV